MRIKSAITLARATQFGRLRETDTLLLYRDVSANKSDNEVPTPFLTGEYMESIDDGIAVAAEAAKIHGSWQGWLDGLADGVGTGLLKGSEAGSVFGEAAGMAWAYSLLPAESISSKYAEKCDKLTMLLRRGGPGDVSAETWNQEEFDKIKAALKAAKASRSSVVPKPSST